jgi:hypothetical protein
VESSRVEDTIKACQYLHQPYLCSRLMLLFPHCAVLCCLLGGAALQHRILSAQPYYYLTQ